MLPSYTADSDLASIQLVATDMDLTLLHDDKSMPTGMDERIEALAPEVMRDVRGTRKPICANIDLYTGFIYHMLGIPEALFTPLFAVARTAGWAAHRMEELICAHRIIRPAYRSVMDEQAYVPLAERLGGHGICQAG